MKKISLIIPTYNKLGILLWNLRELSNQSLSQDLFEVIVVDDSSADGTFDAVKNLSTNYSLRVLSTGQNSGPAHARNLGVENASGDIVCFIGDDTIATRHFLFRHLLAHKQKGFPCVIQGYTDWHPAIPPDDFHRFLHGQTKLGGGGLQANWGALRRDGKWISPDQEIPGWLLTTNVSMPKETFEFYGGFSETFPHAAWEDIDLSIRFLQFGVKTYLECNAINHHYHKQTLDGFVERQIMEGKSRLHLVALHPHMGPQLLDVEGLRNSNADLLSQHIELARELHYNQDPAVQEVRQQRWQFALRLASLEGIRQGLRERGAHSPVWRAIEHLHVNDAIVQIVGCAAAWERGDLEYATVCYEWANKAEPDCWAMPAVRGEILLKQGMTFEALAAFRESMSKSAGEKWPLGRVEELSK